MQKISPHSTVADSLLTLLSASLKGFSQVLLVENKISGCLILLGISLHSPLLGFMAFCSAVVGNVTAKYCGGDEVLIRQGIYSFNSILAGVAVMLFLHDTIRWSIALVAAAAAAILLSSLGKMFAKWDIPLLTFPFVIVTWIGLLLTYQIPAVHINPNFVTSSPAQWNIPYEGKPTLWIGLIKGIGEVFIIDSFWAGCFILIALFFAGWKFGVFAIIGALASWLTAYLIGVDLQSLDLGLYNYNAVLTIIAVSIIFDEKTRRLPQTGILAAMLTVPVTAGLETLLNPLGLPALTFPFIICTWLTLAARKHFP